MRELTERDVIRTNNSPTGDIAELVVADHYDGERGSFSQLGWDVLAPDGERIQVKSLRKMPGKKRTNFSPISEDEYDSVVIVIFNEDFQVTEGLKLSRASVEEMFGLNKKGQRIIRWTKKLRDDPRGEPVDFSSAASWLMPVVD